MTDRSRVKVARLADADRVTFGPLAHYRPLIADGNSAIRTGVQVSEPGYVAPMHQHPYTELLHILSGTAEAWLEGQEDRPIRLEAGDMIELPPNIPHSFRVVGDQPMRLLGIHLSRDRIVEYRDRKTDARGYPVLGAAGG